MAAKKYRIQLTSDERNDLTQLISRGKVAARKLIHTQILLHADEESSAGSLKDTAIAKAVHCSRLTVERVRKRFVTEGLKSALNPKVEEIWGECLCVAFGYISECSVLSQREDDVLILTNYSSSNINECSVFVSVLYNSS